MTTAATKVAAIDLGPPPRRVRRRKGWAVIIITRYIFLPAIVLVVVLVCGLAVTAMWGTRSDAVITDIRTKRLSSGNTTRVIEYSIELDGDRRSHSQRVDSWTTNWKPGDAINVRSVKLLGWRFSTLADGWDGFLDLYVMVIYLAIVLVLIGVPLSIHRGWIVPRRQKRLICNGVVTTATITDIPPSPQPTCDYQYFDVTGEQVVGTVALPPLMAAGLKEGDALTIVYDPPSSSRHVVYEMGDFEVVGGGATVS